MRLQGWPELVMSRGRTVVENNTLNVARGSGRYIARRQPEVMVNAKTPANSSRLPGLLGLKGKAWQRA